MCIYVHIYMHTYMLEQKYTNVHMKLCTHIQYTYILMYIHTLVHTHGSICIDGMRKKDRQRVVTWVYSKAL